MTSEIITSLASASAVAIYLPPDPAFPLVAAALGIYLSLKSKGISVDIVCPTPMTVAESRLIGVDQIKTELPGRNLVISFNYVKDAIEKVSYNVENGKFNLLVQPKAGHQPLSAENVSFQLAGNQADLVILVGSAAAPAAGQDLPTLSLIKNAGRSLAAETTALIQAANLPLDQDIATNLLLGLSDETDRFTQASADDFASAAGLARLGGSLGQTPIYKAQDAEAKPKLDLSSQQWSGPKIFHSTGDVI